jgi:hypothetical protein
MSDTQTETKKADFAANLATPDQPERGPFYHDGAAYYARNASGEWIAYNERNFRLHLREAGYINKAADDLGISEVDAVVLRTQRDHKLDYVGTVAGIHAGYYEWGNTRALITRTPRLIKPAPGTWDTIHDWLEVLLVDKTDPFEQMNPFIGWLRHAVCSLYGNTPNGGAALVLAGQVDGGKTQLKEFIRRLFGGDESQPFKYMTGRDNFNAQLTAAPLWVIDDAMSNTSTIQRAEIGAEIKQMTAAARLSFRGMGKTAVSLACFRRLVFCVNLEADKILVLPPLAADINDKMLMLKVFARIPDWPMPVQNIEEQREFWRVIKSEMPAFIHWLLHEVTPAANWAGRFGVRHVNHPAEHLHHPEIVALLHSVSTEKRMFQNIKRVFTFGDTAGDIEDAYNAYYDRRREAYVMSRAELQDIMTGENSGLQYEDRKYYSGNYYDTHLSATINQYPQYLETIHTNKGNKVVIYDWRKIDDEALQSEGGEV